MKKIVKKAMKQKIKTGTNPLVVAKWMATYNKVVRVQKGLRN